MIAFSFHSPLAFVLEVVGIVTGLFQTETKRMSEIQRVGEGGGGFEKSLRSQTLRADWWDLTLAKNYPD